MRVLVLGSGGREHALCWAIGRSPLVDEVICAPGNDGMRGDARPVPVDLADLPSIVQLARDERADLVVVGPEDPLAAGIVDRLAEAGIAAFGPGAEAARLESSKLFAKEFMQRHGIPTAAHRAFDTPEAAERFVVERFRSHFQSDGEGACVVKADGLAAGKGVFVCSDVEAARAAIDEIMRDRRFGSAGGRVLIEDRLVGEEVSFYAICDGERFVSLASAQDFKRALDGDAGENTGGVGAYSPVPFVDDAMQQRIVREIVRPVFDGMRAEGRPFKGVLYAGLMIVDGEPHVIEFNVRFGDPETQALMLRLESDLVPVLLASAAGSLDEVQLRWADAAVCVVLTSEGYPRSYATGMLIEGLEAAACDDVVIFHSGTRRGPEGLVTAGGRVLGVTARGATLAAGRRLAYEAAGQIDWKGVCYRRDIAERVTRSSL